MRHFGSFIGGKHRINDSSTTVEVRNPYNSALLATLYCATIEDIEDAIDNAHTVFESTMRHLSAHKRSKILRTAASLLEQRAERFAETLSKEAGKPLVEARTEVARAVQVLLFASEAARNLNGEQIVMDSAVGGEQQLGFTKRVPLGVIAAITPFNFPLNLCLHKIAPAIAAGNTVVLKPAEKTPLSAIELFHLLKEAGLPDGALNILNGPGVDIVEPLVTHPLVKKVTFTGSDQVGWHIRELARGKQVTLELGSNAPNIIFDFDS